MLRKALLLCFAYYAFALVLTGCHKHIIEPAQTLRWTGIRVNNWSYTITSEGSISMTQTNGDHRNKGYLMGITTNYEFLASNYDSRNFLINEAYACDPGP